MTGETRWRAAPLPPLRSIGLVAAGGAAGGLGRALLGVWAPVRPGAFPWVTFSENLLGAFLLGLLLTLLLERVIERQWLGVFLGTGMLGAFTTFATLAYQLQRLWVDGYPVTAGVYAVSSLSVGLAAAMAGVAAAHRLAMRRGAL